MELMKEFEDNYFDLAIVDPPYGVGISNKKIGYSIASRLVAKTNWDKEAPNEEYFAELMRVSKNQIIWGGNCFGLPANKGFIIWDKLNEGRNFSEIEYAWTNMDIIPRKFTFGVLNSNTKREKNKIHPCQKPVQLYEWMLKNYAETGNKILDTHLGSGSIAIAVENMNKRHGMNLTLTASEIDKKYFEDAMKRIQDAKAQVEISFNH